MGNILNHDIPFDKYFEEISRIPRGSGNEAGIADYFVKFAEEHSFRYYRDSLNNVVIYKPGTPGYENAPTVILQAHSDMVCVKEPWSNHDFQKDPIELVYENGILRANGTSLGADNGTGVATILGLLAETDIDCPPIEALLTASEETGMQGAAGFDYSHLTGRRLIGMDSGGENETSVNAASCETVKLTLVVKKEAPAEKCLRLRISGLKGGHSGVCIDLERGNAIKIAAGVLRECFRGGVALQIASFEAGTASNAIPDFCEVVFASNDGPLVKKLTEAYAMELRRSLADDEPDVSVTLEEVGSVEDALNEADSHRLVDLLTLLPSGRRHKSTQIADFVTASSNLATVLMTDSAVQIEFSMRADNDIKLRELEDEVEALARILDVEMESLEKTPCWEYRADSVMREKAAELMPTVMGVPLKIEYVHGGLECGYFAANIPDVDIFVIGPIGREVHSTKEWLNMDSAHRVYDFLVKYLAALKD